MRVIVSYANVTLRNRVSVVAALYIWNVITCSVGLTYLRKVYSDLSDETLALNACVAQLWDRNPTDLVRETIELE